MFNRHILTSQQFNNVILKSIKEAFLNAYNIIASFFGGFVIIFAYFGDQKNGWFQPFIYGVAVYIIIFIILFNIRLTINLAKLLNSLDYYNIYGESVKYMNSAFALVHSSNRNSHNKAGDILSVLTAFCTVAKEFFDKKTEGECSVCIKIILNDELDSNKLRIYTICRDYHHLTKREPKNGDIKHYVHDNTCFSHIINNLPQRNGRYYLNNNLIIDSGYKNSSSEYYGNIQNNLTQEQKSKQWTLPYRSELIVPIVPFSEPAKAQIKGFFCIDCDKIEVFNEKYDTELAMGIADGLFNTISKNSKILNSK